MKSQMPSPLSHPGAPSTLTPTLTFPVLLVCPRPQGLPLTLLVGVDNQLVPFQKINHFPGMTEICRKDLLARNLNRMQKLYPAEYNIFPRTWCLPAE